MKRWTAALCLMLLAAAPVRARNADAALEMLIAPNNGRPACVSAGQGFEILLGTNGAQLTLEALGKAYPLEAGDAVPWGTGVRLHCTVPEAVPPGVYALRAGQDVNPAAVHVLAEAPAEYLLAFMAAPGPGGGAPDDVLRAAIGDAHSQGAALFVLAGVHQGFERLARVLDDAPLPVHVIPAGNGARAFQRYFGPAQGAFRFGPDGYLCFTAGEGPAVAEPGNDAAVLQRWQRKLRSSRWRIGLGGRAGALMDLRLQLVLFVDNPLDYCLIAETPAGEAAPPIVRSPWGSTQIGAPPASAQGFVLIHVTPAGLRPLLDAAPE